MIKLCPCGSKIAYLKCCGIYHTEKEAAKTPEQLMRARYSAYALEKFDYIQKTMQGKPLMNFNLEKTSVSSKYIQWIKLKILKTTNISPENGLVEFIAYFIEDDKLNLIHEISEFQFIKNQWFYVSGSHINTKIDSKEKKYGETLLAHVKAEKNLKIVMNKKIINKPK